jgi:dipeptidyl aminopeptidase/acylaminoacyl peptidase
MLSVEASSKPEASAPSSRRPVWILVLLTLLLVLPGATFGLMMTLLQCMPAQFPPVQTPADVKLPFEVVRRIGPDGVPLVGWYIPPPKMPAPAVVVLHGHVGRKDNFLDVASFLRRAGFGVLMFDFRHHGESGAAPCTFGLRESEEVLPFVAFLKDRAEHRGAKIGILGYSMGATTALRAMSICPDLAACVADSAFSSFTEQGRYRIGQFVPAPLVGYFWTFSSLIGSVVAGFTPGELEVSLWLPKIAPRPLFFIHGTADGNVLPHHSEALAQAATGPVSHWPVSNAAHIASRHKEPKEYQKRVVDFFTTSLR